MLVAGRQHHEYALESHTVCICLVIQTVRLGGTHGSIGRRDDLVCCYISYWHEVRVKFRHLRYITGFLLNPPKRYCFD